MNCLGQLEPTQQTSYDLNRETPESEQSLIDFLGSHVYDQENKILEAQKLLTSKLGENLGVSQIKTFQAEGNQIFGVYLHRQPSKNLGLTGSVVRIDVEDFDAA